MCQMHRDYISNLAMKDLGVSPEEMGKVWYESTTEIADFHNLEPEESRLEHWAIQNTAVFSKGKHNINSSKIAVCGNVCNIWYHCQVGTVFYLTVTQDFTGIYK